MVFGPLPADITLKKKKKTNSNGTNGIFMNFSSEQFYYSVINLLNLSLNLTRIPNLNDNITFKITQFRLLFSYTYKNKRIQEVKLVLLLLKFR